MKYLFSVLIGCFLLLGVASVHAQSSTFDIRVYGGDDVVPPSTPTLLTADPIVTTQIDLTWSTSTDNFVVSGYVVYRGSSTIATTTQLNYSDTGLTPSTTYSYSVKAFDPSFNYSSSSNILSATTPSIPVPVEETYPEATAARVVLAEMNINEGVSTTSLDLKTKRPARLELRWGRTSSYELGYIVSSIFIRNHSFLLTELEPGTTYEFELIGYTQHGNPVLLKAGSFTTSKEADTTPPANVSDFKARVVNNDVFLSWQLPQNELISQVRIVRSHLGYPEFTNDGAIIYQGLSTEALDDDVLSRYSPAYYTAFVYDEAGNVSSGAIAIAYAGGDGPGGDYSKIPPVIEEATSSINKDRLTVDMKMPDLSDLIISQGSIMHTFIDKSLVLDSDRPFTVSVPVSKVAGNLKSIILTVLDPTNHHQAFSYLMRLNRDRTAYTASVPAILVSGHSQVQVEIYDYEAFVVGTYQAPITFSPDVMKDDASFEETFLGKLKLFGIGILLLGILLWLLIFLAKRKTEDNV